MNCCHCGTKLIWGGDHDGEDDQDYLIVSNLSCPGCNSYVLVYLPRDEEDEEMACAPQDSGMQT